MSLRYGPQLARLLLFAAIQVGLGSVDICPPVAQVGRDYRLECSFQYNNSLRNYNWQVLDRNHGADWSNLASCHGLKCTNFTPRASALVIFGVGTFTWSSLLLHNLTARDSGALIRCESWDQEEMRLHRRIVCRLDVQSTLEVMKSNEDYEDPEVTSELPVSFDSTTNHFDVQANSPKSTLNLLDTTNVTNDSGRKSTTMSIHPSTTTIDFSPSAKQLSQTNNDQVKLTELSVVSSSSVHQKDVFVYCTLTAIFCLLVFIGIVVGRNKGNNTSRSHDKGPTYHSTYQENHTYASVHCSNNSCEALPPPPKPHRQIEQHIYSEAVSTASIQLATLNNSVTLSSSHLDNPENETTHMMPMDSIYIDTITESDHCNLTHSDYVPNTNACIPVYD